MGNVYSVHCSTCGYSVQLHLGGGLNSIKLPFLLARLSNADREKLTELQEHGIKYAVGTNYIAKKCRCHSTPSFCETLVVDVTDKDGASHRLGGVCEECGKPLELLDISKPLMCPRCFDTGIIPRIVGRWD